MKKCSITIGILFATFCLLLIAAAPGYAYNVYPDDPYWGPDERTAGENESNAGTVEISDEQPRDGNASLKLSLGGSENWEDDLDDWAFYTITADDDDGWGLLSDITALSFDWYVDSIDTSNVDDNDPFNYQTPVLRLLIKDGDTITELIWEQYYTDGNATLTMGEWVTEDLVSEDLVDQYFWQYISSAADGDKTGYVTESGDILEDFTGLALMDETIESWSLSDFFSENAIVYGLSIGVGSYWKGAYLAYVDNIYLAFGNEVVLDDNFELPVPEPSTLLLLAAGMAIILLAGRRRRARG